MTASKISAYKGGLFTLCQSLFPAPALVVYGHPGTNLADDIVAIRNASSEQVWAALGQQKKDEQVQQDIVINCWRGGEQQQTVTERAFTMLDTLDAAIRKPAATATLGGIVRDHYISGLTVTEAEPGAVNADGVDLIAKGRWTELVVTLTANIRL